jgi:hypothetical protein
MPREVARNGNAVFDGYSDTWVAMDRLVKKNKLNDWKRDEEGLS